MSFREKRRGPSFKCAACEARNVINVEDLEEAGYKFQPLDSHNPDDLVSDTDDDEPEEDYS